ncbi:MAG: protein-export chaperone SecB [bacterium]
MSENEATQTEPVFEIQRVYLKDGSFESPAAPAIFTKPFQPESNVELNSHSKKLADNIYEVELNITLTVKSEGEVAYLVEVKQAGVFSAAGYSEEQLAHLLGAYCPNIIYPFARETISDLAVRGGFPQILLAPINFDMLYANHLQEQAAQQEASADSQTH